MWGRRVVHRPVPQQVLAQMPGAWPVQGYLPAPELARRQLKPLV